jgi:hypothetical protein
MSATKKMWTRRWHNAVNYVHASKLSHSISDVNFFTVLVFVLQFVIDLFLLTPRVVHAGFTRYCKTTWLILMTGACVFGLWILLKPDPVAAAAKRADQLASIEVLTSTANSLASPACFKEKVNARMAESTAPITMYQMDVLAKLCTDEADARAAAELATKQRNVFKEEK